MIIDNITKIIDLFLNELSSVKRVSKNTLQSYKTDLTQFATFCVEKKITDITLITTNFIRKYIVTLNEQKLKKTSISRKLSALRSLFEFALKNDLLNKNILKEISNPKIKRNLPETIDLDSLLKIYKLTFKTEEENKAKLINSIFELLYGCALRVSELCSLKISDLNTEQKYLRVFGKGSKERIVPVGTKSLLVVAEYMKTQNYNSPQDYLLKTPKGKQLYPELVYRFVKKYISEVSDIKKKSPHVLRHSAATHMLNNDADLLAVKEILGHENLSTTQIYTHVSIERLKNTFKKAHPKS